MGAGIFLFTLSDVAHAIEKSPRLLVHLLDYLAKDYAGAVAPGGRVISESEYKEQLEFSDEAVAASEGLKDLDSAPDVNAGVAALQRMIAAKGDPIDVAKLARGIQRRVIDVTHLAVAPVKWPNVPRGKELFAANCTSCHGVDGRGDGPAAAALEPKPANFQDQQTMTDLTPLQVFDTARLGVPGTPMPPFPALSDEDLWNVAFYVISMRHAGAEAPATRAEGDFGADALQRAATTSDSELLKTIPPAAVAAIRLHSAGFDSPLASLDTARNLIDRALETYRRGDYDGAKTSALKAYLDGIEPIEPRLRATDPEFVATLEEKMGAVRGAIDAKMPVDAVDAAVTVAKTQLEAAGALLGHQELSPGIAFTAAAAILLREGFEAVLLILALLSVIRATGSKRAALYVHGGWIAALACGGLAWLFSGYLINISGASREMMEAWTSLFAVLVLIVVGFWLHSRTEIGRWNHFLKVKVRAAMEHKRLFGLAAISFIAVFREAFETVLFLRAVWLEGGQSARAAMGAGVGLTLLLIIFGAWLVLRFSARIPVRKLFAASAFIMGILAFILTGKGLHSLQETGALGVTSARWSFRSEIFGLYPTVETLLPQVVVLALIIALWRFGKRPSRRLSARAT